MLRKNNIVQDLSHFARNMRYLERYARFISAYLSNEGIGETYEKHYILPRSMFPERAKDPSNIVRLPIRAHFIAHWMLAKATNHPGMWFAFNQMRRTGRRSALYQFAKVHIRSAISISNSGRTRAPEHIEALRNSICGKKPARYPDGCIRWTAADDPRWSTGEIFHAAIGRSHSEATKQKMSKANSSRRYYIGQTGDIRRFNVDEVPAGYTAVIPDFCKISKTGGTEWYHSPETKQHLRIGCGDTVPTGYVKGKLHSSFDHINMSDKKKYLNVETKTYEMISKGEFDPETHVRFDGTSIDKIFVTVFERTIFVGNANSITGLSELGVFVNLNELAGGIIKSPHPNHRKESIEFRRVNAGKVVHELGIFYGKLTSDQLPIFNQIYQPSKDK